MRTMPPWKACQIEGTAEENIKKYTSTIITDAHDS